MRETRVRYRIEGEIYQNPKDRREVNKRSLPTLIHSVYLSSRFALCHITPTADNSKRIKIEYIKLIKLFRVERYRLPDE